MSYLTQAAVGTGRSEQRHEQLELFFVVVARNEHAIVK